MKIVLHSCLKRGVCIQKIDAKVHAELHTHYKLIKNMNVPLVALAPKELTSAPLIVINPKENIKKCISSVIAYSFNVN